MLQSHSELVKQHFDIKYQDYDNLIRKLIPKYDEMHVMVLNLLDYPLDAGLCILDLGIGTGQTSLELLAKFPNLYIDGVDVSQNMILQAKLRLSDYIERVNLYNENMTQFDLRNEYDGCVAVLSVHHLDGQQKADLFKKVYDGLRSGGMFVIGDLIKFDNRKETEAKENEWKQFIISSLGEKEGTYWYDNYLEEDLPSSVGQQLSWLKEAGFKDVGKVWEHMNYAVIYARKE